MQHVAHSDWMFDHSLGHHLNTSVDPHSAISTDTTQEMQSTQAGAAASVATTLWHHTSDPAGGLSTTQGSSGRLVSSNASNSSSATASPTVTVASSALNNGLTVNAGGSVSLPISVLPANGHTSVTISGLTSYETVTDSLDHHTFTPDANGSVTLSAAEVNSGLSLNSNPSASLAAQHPVNTLTVTASEAVAGHALTSAPETITITDPPASTSGSGSSTSSGTNTLTLQVSGDQYNGDPQVEVFVDGQQIGGTYTVTADHASGQTQTITITGNFDPTQAHQVQVEFVNDAWDGTSWWSNGGSADGHDRNVYVESIALNGQTLEGSQGADAATNGAVSAANANEAVMDVNGTLTFNVPADPPATTSASATGASGSSTSSAATTGTATSSGTSTDPTTSSVGTGAPDPAQTTNAFYVSPNGNDSNPGTLAAPFATLQHAQQAMENSSIKTTYVEGGTYNMSSTLTLTSADDGETWSYYQPNGVNTAVLDGGGGLNPVISIGGGTSNITIDGIKIQNFGQAGIYVGAQGAAASGITVENCDIGDGGISGNTTAAVIFENVTNSTIANNYVHDMQGMGIDLYAYYSGESVNGDVVENNVVLNTVEGLSDGGAIYVDMYGTGTSGGSVAIKNNFVSNYSGPGQNDGHGIYLDDDASNVTVTGNIIGPAAAGAGGNCQSAYTVHNGSNDVFSGNIVDLGSDGNTFAAIWFQDGGSGMSGNTFTGNIVVSSYTGNLSTSYNGVTGDMYYENTSASDYTIENNIYYNSAGGQLNANGPNASDSNAIFENPDLSGSLYTLSSTSPVFSSAANFSPIVGGWGPPGFTIPSSATQSST